MTGITKFKYGRKNEKDCGRSSKMTPSCKWPIPSPVAIEGPRGKFARPRLPEVSLNPSGPSNEYPRTIHQTDFHTFPSKICCEKSIFPSPIILLILIGFSLDDVLILLRENSCWSPLLRKGLSWLIWWTSWMLSHFSAFISIKFIAWLIWDCWNAAGSKLKAINLKGGKKPSAHLGYQRDQNQKWK